MTERKSKIEEALDVLVRNMCEAYASLAIVENLQKEAREHKIGPRSEFWSFVLSMSISHLIMAIGRLTDTGRGSISVGSLLLKLKNNPHSCADSVQRIGQKETAARVEELYQRWASWLASDEGISATRDLRDKRFAHDDERREILYKDNYPIKDAKKVLNELDVLLNDVYGLRAGSGLDWQEVYRQVKDDITFSLKMRAQGEACTRWQRTKGACRGMDPLGE